MELLHLEIPESTTGTSYILAEKQESTWFGIQDGLNMDPIGAVSKETCIDYTEKWSFFYII